MIGLRSTFANSFGIEFVAIMSFTPAAMIFCVAFLIRRAWVHITNILPDRPNRLSASHALTILSPVLIMSSRIITSFLPN